MSLSAHSPSLAGGLPPVGASWGNSPYGSLVTLGPRTFKKKPVLVLDAEELAQAHLAIAMGGAEIMETAPDPVEAPRPRAPAMLLGLAPMGAEEADEDLAAYPAAALAAAAADDWDEPAEEEAEVQTWTPEDEPEDELAEELADWGENTFAEPEAEPEAVIAPTFAEPTLDEPVVPTIEEQIERMRQRLAKRSATGAQTAPSLSAILAAASPRPSEVSRVPTIERIEIDDWSQRESLKGFIPPQESDLAPQAPPPAPPPPAEPPPATVPQLVAPMPEPEPVPEPIPEPVAEPEPEPVDDLLDLGESMVADETALDAWQEHVVPLAPTAPRRASPIRARLRDSADWTGAADEVPPSLLARLVAWLRGLF